MNDHVQHASHENCTAIGNSGHPLNQDYATTIKITRKKTKDVGAKMCYLKTFCLMTLLFSCFICYCFAHPGRLAKDG